MNRLKQRKSYLFKLGGIFLIFLVIGSLLMLYLNDKLVKYEKYEFTETEEMHIQAQSGYEIINPYRDYYIFPTRISPYESYHLAEEKLGYYMVAYRNSNLEQYQKNTYQYFKTITWYKFETNKVIPSNIDNMEIVDVIAVVKEKRTKDLFTNFEFELESDKYIRCEYEVNEEEVKIIGDVPIKEEYIAYGSRVHNQEEFDLMYGTYFGNYLWNVGVLLHWDNLEYKVGLSECLDYYNIRTLDGQKYLEFKLYEVVDGEFKILSQSGTREWVSDKLEQIKYKEITSNDGKYIMGLYPLNEAIKIFIRSSK